MDTLPQNIIALGEILWDVFPDRTCFGGAPANFACAAAELSDGGASVQMLSGIGQDELGTEALAQLQSHGVGLGLVQQNGFPTGQVNVELDSSGKANYVFMEDVAWDNLEWNGVCLEAAQQANAVCFGSLGQRSESSAAIIQRFVENTPPNCLRVFDINLRFPHVSDSAILRSMELANILKLNDEELPYLAKLVQAQGDDEITQLDWIRQRFDLDLVAVTSGPEGVVLHTADHTVRCVTESVQVVDTVGAGDSFTAAMTLGLLRYSGPNRQVPSTPEYLESLGRIANEVAAYVCGQPGATPVFPASLKQKFSFTP